MKIEKGIPIPPAGRTGRPRVYKFEELEVGDSAMFDASYNAVFGALTRFRTDPRYVEWKFRVATVGPKKSRVWRVS